MSTRSRAYRSPDSSPKASASTSPRKKSFDNGGRE
jgi:hypothetical protein